MTVALIGLGRIGKNVALHLLEQGVSVIVYNRSPDDIDTLVAKGAIGAYTLSEIPNKFSDYPIVVILYLPALPANATHNALQAGGAPIDEVLFGARGRTVTVEQDSPRELVQKGLIDILPHGSIIIDGGNSFFKDSQRRYQELRTRNMYFLDMGTSGGIEGARNGACLMVGGDETVYKQVRPVLEKIATPGGLGYFGPTGTGHYVKMIHNAIEYGMMGAIAEGFNLVRSWQFAVGSNSEFKINLVKLAKVWAHGSIVSGHLMDMAVRAFSKDPQLESIVGEVPKGETEREMEWLERTGIPNPVIQQARLERVETRSKPSFIGKVIAALRREFGGHKVKEAK